MLAVVAALLLTAAGSTVLGQAVTARHRAAVAADLAALAAADVLLGRVPGDACARAAATAAANGGRLVSCRSAPGTSAAVEVSVAPVGAAAALGEAVARAHAGPPRGSG